MYLPKSRVLHFLKESTAALNYFSKTDYLTRAKEPSLPYLLIATHK